MMEDNKRIICEPKKEPFVRLYIIAAGLIGMGLYCAYDASTGKYPPPEVWDMKHVNEAAGYIFNHYMLYVLGPIGLVLAYVGFAKSRLVFIADDEGMGYQGKKKYAWSDIKMLDASELKSKGWIKIEVAEETITLDSWKLANFKALVAKIEENVADDKKKV